MGYIGGAKEVSRGRLVVCRFLYVVLFMPYAVGTTVVAAIADVVGRLYVMLSWLSGKSGEFPAWCTATCIMNSAWDRFDTLKDGFP